MSHAKSTIFTDAQIWQGADKKDERAMLVTNGVIVAFGQAAIDQAEELGRRGESDHTTDVTRVQCGGKFLMPSFGDCHAHPLYGGLEEDGPAVRGLGSVAEIVEEVARYARENQEQEWILGASYDGSLAENGLFDAKWLDEAVADRPVVLRAWDYHTVWCNSLALEKAGITAHTPQPELGEIVHREDGSPLGILREWGAVDLMSHVQPRRTLEQRVQALARATAHYSSLGVTWVQDAWVEAEDVEVFCEAAARGLLTSRINLALLADPRTFPEQLDTMLASRETVRQLNHPLLTAESVKFFADGVVENETGALLEPYCSGLHDHGMLVWTPKHLAESVTTIDAHGFQAHIHAIGDAAVRISLDAIETAIKTNGERDRRAVIAHVQLAKEEDLQRFATLGIVAALQPLWAQQDALMKVLTVPRLGDERSDTQYRFRSLARSGAPIAFGSDWPVSSANPFDGMRVAVTRLSESDEPVGGWTPHETIDIIDALTAYTAGVAFQAFADHRDHPWGVLMAGASADFVVLDQDPRDTPSGKLNDVTVCETYLRGVRVFALPE